jgi:predicted DNA-binding protein YlxM (UPF0122 family)
MEDDLKNKIKWKATSKKWKNISKQKIEDDLKKMKEDLNKIEDDLNKKFKNGRRPQKYQKAFFWHTTNQQNQPNWL